MFWSNGHGKDRLIAEQHAEMTRLREDILRWRHGRDEINRELGGLRTQNIQLHRDNARMAHELEMVLVQFAAANDERVALLRSRGVPVNDPPQMSVEKPAGTLPAAPPPIWGTPMDDERDGIKTIAAIEAASNASLFEDPGDAVAEQLGRRHSEFGEVEYVQGR